MIMSKMTNKKNAQRAISLEEVCDKALALANLNFLSEADEIQIANIVSTVFFENGAWVSFIRRLLREREPNNWCTTALRSAALGPAPPLQLHKDGQCPACRCKVEFNDYFRATKCPCCERTFAPDTGEQVEDQRWLQTAPGVFEDWSFAARVARGETRKLEDLPPTTLSGICAATRMQHGAPMAEVAEAIKSVHFKGDSAMTISRIESRLIDLHGMRFTDQLMSSVTEFR
jgi:hypothetical protein